MASKLIASVAPVTRRVRAFFAPVNRAAKSATVFDAAGIAGFDVDAPASPWVDLGWCKGFVRKSGTKIEPVVTGAPGVAKGQVRTEVEALVSVEFESWGKLQMALSCGVQQMNVLRVQTGAAANGSGGAAIGAVPLSVDSTASSLNLGSSAAASGFVVGDLVAVDVDYGAQAGFVGSGGSGGYVGADSAVDVDYVRRVTLNVGRVTGISGGVLTLGEELLAGVPTASMKVSRVAGFCDREGARFFQEWSALFVMDGVQGDRVMYHYPRLQSAAGVAEIEDVVGTSLERVRLAGSWRALPVKDANDGEMVVCFRSYLPGALRAV
jgi:hypothetical protein